MVAVGGWGAEDSSGMQGCEGGAKAGPRDWLLVAAFVVCNLGTFLTEFSEEPG